MSPCGTFETGDRPRSSGRLGSPAAGEVSGATDDDDAITAASASMRQTGVAVAMMRVSGSGPSITLVGVDFNDLHQTDFII